MRALDIGSEDFGAETYAAEAVAAGVAYFEHWGKTSIALGNPIGATLGGFAVRLAESRNSWRQIVREAISILTNSVTSGEGSSATLLMTRLLGSLA